MTHWLDHDEAAQSLGGEPIVGGNLVIYERVWQDLQEQYEQQDPDGSIRSLYKRVWVELGGPHPLPGVRDLNDGRGLFLACIIFPCRRWEWHLSPQAADDLADLRWWPWLAWMADEQSRVGFAEGRQADMSLAEIDRSLGRIGTSLRSAAHEIGRLSRANSLPRPPFEGETNKGTLLRELVDAITEGWVAATGVKRSLFTGMPTAPLSAFADSVRDGTNRIQGLHPAAFKVGAERIPGLVNLVWIAGAIWKAREGVNPSAENVERKDGETDSPFVRFVTGVCNLTGSYPPTANQVKDKLAKARGAGRW